MGKARRYLGHCLVVATALFHHPVAPARMTDEELITQQIAEIAATADLYPGVIILHHVPTQTVRYMSKMGLELLDTTQEALRALGPAYWPTYFNPVESKTHMERVYGLMYEENKPSVHTFFQQVKTVEREGYSLYLTSMRKLLVGESGEPLLLIGLAVPLHPENHFAAKIARLLDENTFLRSHAATFANLTGRERQVLTHLARSRSSGEIAEALFISTQTVDTHRRNLRQKLGASNAFELGQYARAFDLI